MALASGSRRTSGPSAAIAAAAVSFTTATGLQLVRDTADLPLVYAPQFDALVAADGAHDASARHAQDARFGVYLHALADRITHHVCTDRSVIAGPTASGFQIAFTDDECKQPIHLLRHAWETGVDFRLLAAQDRTTPAMLSTIYDEFVELARARGLLRTGADTAAAKAAYVGALTSALTQYAALDRVRAIDAVGCAHGLVPLPGQPACQ